MDSDYVPPNACLSPCARRLSPDAHLASPVARCSSPITHLPEWASFILVTCCEESLCPVYNVYSIVAFDQIERQFGQVQRVVNYTDDSLLCNNLVIECYRRKLDTIAV
jgi:hypothetical protein